VANLLTLLIAYVQDGNYWGFLLLGCNYRVIESSPCLCAIRRLLNSFFAYVQTDVYWFALLLMCRLCAGSPLLRKNLAIMQFHYYRRYRLLMCKYVII